MEKVALISHSPYLLGAERMLLNMALILLKTEKYKPVVFLPTVKGITEFNIACEENDIQIVCMEKYVQYIFVSQASLSDVASETIESIKELETLYMKWGINKIVVNTMTAISPVIAAKNLEIPVALWSHGILDPFFIFGETFVERRLLYDRLLLALCDKVVCCSEWTARYYRRFAPEVEVLTNWTESPLYIKDELPEENIFICLNTFSEEKGIFTLLNAVRILKTRGKEFKLILYGTGLPDFVQKMEKYISENKLNPFIEIRERVIDVNKAYRESICLVQPSVIESFGMTVIEAMANQRMVISACSGGPEEIIINNKTGYLVPRNDAEELANKMELCIDNPNIALNMGGEGRKRFEKNYSSDAARNNIEKVLEQLRYKEDNTQLLIKDMVVYQTSIEANKFETDRKRTYLETLMETTYNENKLSFTGEIENSRKYRIRFKGYINCIGLIFTSLDDLEAKGNVEVKIYHKGTLVSSGKTLLEDIVKNKWTYINLEKTLKYEKGELVTIEVIFKYDKNSAKFGVYEIANPSMKIYRFCRKYLNIIVGTNVLLYTTQ